MHQDSIHGFRFHSSKSSHINGTVGSFNHFIPGSSTFSFNLKMQKNKTKKLYSFYQNFSRHSWQGSSTMSTRSIRIFTLYFSIYLSDKRVSRHSSQYCSLTICGLEQAIEPIDHPDWYKSGIKPFKSESNTSTCWRARLHALSCVLISKPVRSLREKVQWLAIYHFD